MKEWVGDGKLIIISMTVSSTNDRYHLDFPQARRSFGCQQLHQIYLPVFLAILQLYACMYVCMYCSSINNKQLTISRYKSHRVLTKKLLKTQLTKKHKHCQHNKKQGMVSLSLWFSVKICYKFFQSSGMVCHMRRKYMSDIPTHTDIK